MVDISSQIVNINEYRLADTADAFVDAMTAVSNRTRTEGESGVLHYAFYVDRDAGTAIGTIVYRDAEAWLSHHRIAYEWPEMGALQATVSLERITFLGPTNDEIDAMAEAVPAPVVRCRTLAAGFSRPG